MRLVEYKGCCTAKIVTGFGQDNVTAEHRYRPDEDPTVADVSAELAKMEKVMVRSGHAIISCIVNDKQTSAVEGLRLAGYTGSGWGAKEQHPETQVQLFYKLLNPVGGA